MSSTTDATGLRVPVPATPAELTRAQQIALWLDERYLDPIIGLVVPGLGDLVTAGFGVYLVGLGVRMRLPVVVIARMLGNLGLDVAMGSIPLLGDVVDFGFKANTRNLRLLQDRHVRRRATTGDWLAVGGAAAGFALALILPVLAVIWVIQRLF